jgi:hypothetical protein
LLAGLFGAAAGAGLGFVVGSLATFFLSVSADGLGVFGGPVPGQHWLVVSLAGKQAFEDIADVGPDIKIVAMRAADQRNEVCIALATGYAAGEQPVLATQGHLLDELSTLPSLYWLFIARLAISLA